MTTADQKRLLARDELNGLALTLLPAIIHTQTLVLEHAATTSAISPGKARGEGAEGAEPPELDPAPFYRRCVELAYIAAAELAKAARSPELLVMRRAKVALDILRDEGLTPEARIAKAIPQLDSLLR